MFSNSSFFGCAVFLNCSIRTCSVLLLIVPIFPACLPNNPLRTFFVTRFIYFLSLLIIFCYLSISPLLSTNAIFSFVFFWEFFLPLFLFDFFRPRPIFCYAFLITVPLAPFSLLFPIYLSCIYSHHYYCLVFWCEEANGRLQIWAFSCRAYD